jgi:hypothetical protein
MTAGSSCSLRGSSTPVANWDGPLRLCLRACVAAWAKRVRGERTPIIGAARLSANCREQLPLPFVNSLVASGHKYPLVRFCRLGRYPQHAPAAEMSHGSSKTLLAALCGYSYPQLKYSGSEYGPIYTFFFKLLDYPLVVHIWAMLVEKVS